MVLYSNSQATFCDICCNHGGHSDASVQRSTGESLYCTRLIVVPWRVKRVDAAVWHRRRPTASSQRATGRKWQWGDSRHTCCDACGLSGTQWNYSHIAVCMLLSDVAFASSGLSRKLRNIVATVNLDCRLDLKTIALHARNAEYNPKVRLSLSKSKYCSSY